MFFHAWVHNSAANTGVHFDGALYVERREYNMYLELGFPE